MMAYSEAPFPIWALTRLPAVSESLLEIPICSKGLHHQ
jgi:hypothetical protein